MLVLSRAHRGDVAPLVADHFSRGERAASAIAFYLDQLSRLHAIFKLVSTSAKLASPIERFSASRMSSRSSATASRSRFFSREYVSADSMSRVSSPGFASAFVAHAPRRSHAPAVGRTALPFPDARSCISSCVIEGSLSVARLVRGDLRRPCTAHALLGQMFLDLLAARTRCLQIFLL